MYRCSVSIISPITICLRSEEGGREGGREGREGGGGREGGRERGRERKRERGEGGREGGREKGRVCRCVIVHCMFVLLPELVLLMSTT